MRLNKYLEQSIMVWMLIVLSNISPEGEVWEYQMVQHECTSEYAFSQGDVYLLKDGVPYLYPTTLSAWAKYGDGWAVMYYRDGLAWGFLMSDFDKYRAVQIGMCAFILYRLDYVLSRVGNINEKRG